MLTDREIETYLDAARELGYLPIFLLALEQGLRQRELIALKWSDLDVKTRTLTIHEGRVVECGKLVDYGGKTRTITLPQFTVEQLIREHEKHPSSEAMFIHPGTLKLYSPGMIRLLHKRVLERAGLEHIITAASWLTAVVLQFEELFGRGSDRGSTPSRRQAALAAGFFAHKQKKYRGSPEQKIRNKKTRKTAKNKQFSVLMYCVDEKDAPNEKFPERGNRQIPVGICRFHWSG